MGLRGAGRIGLVGCSNVDSDQLRAISAVADVSLAQLPVNLLGDGLGSKMKSALDESGAAVVAYNVLKNGLLTGKFDEA
jgi:aryl-alcohol dehydrogenase-like predicted oxidoreductase